MIKRIFAILLMACLLFSNASVASYAAESKGEQMYITIEARGTFYSQRAYIEEETVFVPTALLAQFGKFKISENSSGYTFYRLNETSNSTGKRDFLAGARTITIDKKGKGATVSCYVSKNKAVTVSSVKFSQARTIDKKLYLPLAEMLPLIDAKIEITKDGIVHIYTNPVSAFDALFSGNIDLCAFDASKMIGGTFISVSGLIVDSILNFRFDRLDVVVTHAGAIKDYKSIFKKLLTDNETYLAAFDQSETPFDKAMDLIDSSVGDLDDAASGVKNFIKAYEYLYSSAEHSTYKDFSEYADKQYHSGAELIEAVSKVVGYVETYTSQVEDHRNMLMAVYSNSGTSASTAANEIYSLYGKNNVDQITSAAISALRDYLKDVISSGVIKTVGLTPFKMSLTAVKVFLPEMADTWSEAAELYYLANIVQDSYDVATGLRNNPKFDEASLEKSRLSLIMMNISSKYGYKTFYGEDYDVITAIDPWLEKLYLAADSIECVSAEYYHTKKAELEKACKCVIDKATDSPKGEDLGDEFIQKEITSDLVMNANITVQIFENTGSEEDVVVATGSTNHNVRADWIYMLEDGTIGTHMNYGYICFVTDEEYTLAPGEKLIVAVHNDTYSGDGEAPLFTWGENISVTDSDLAPVTRYRLAKNVNYCIKNTTKSEQCFYFSGNINYGEFVSANSQVDFVWENEEREIVGIDKNNFYSYLDAVSVELNPSDRFWVKPCSDYTDNDYIVIYTLNYGISGEISIFESSVSPLREIELKANYEYSIVNTTDTSLPIYFPGQNIRANLSIYENGELVSNEIGQYISFLRTTEYDIAENGSWVITAFPYWEDEFSSFAFVPYFVDESELEVKELGLVEREGYVTVPDVVGMTQEEAVTLLDGLGLQFQVWWSSSSDVEHGTLYILSQSISAGAYVPEETLVKLQISNVRPQEKPVDTEADSSGGDGAFGGGGGGSR